MDQQVESTSRTGAEQARARMTPADALTIVRLPLAFLFVVINDPWQRFGVLAIASGTDLLDGFIARRIGGSRFGAVLDPIADKLFMACAFGVVAFSGRLQVYEIVGVLIRDIWATIAFLWTIFSGRPTAIPARIGGKAVTVAQVLTILAFIANSSILRPLAWGTAAIGIYAIWDYNHVARKLGQRI